MSKEPVKQQSDDERVERDRQQREDPLYLEKTKPEDPSARPGQLTRDNVNPNIPSGKRGDPPNSGGIVDPKSLGMESQAGVPPPAVRTVEGEIEGSKYSINEPPGSDVYSHVPEGGMPLPEGQKGPGPAPAQRAARGPEASDDPDEIEDELEQMREEGDVETRGKPVPKKK